MSAESIKNSHRKYNSSEKGKARRIKYNHSVKGTECYRRYQDSGNRRTSRTLYRCEHIPLTADKILRLILVGYK
jgi:hypothetical protein